MNKIYLTLKKIINIFRHRYRPATSYSQCGEDIIMNHLVGWLSLAKITYLDIGANDPKKFNNTYFFYKKKSYGVLVEPSPDLYKKISRVRSKDICINAGVGIGDASEMNFYQMIPDTLSTTSANKADEYLAMGVKIKQVISVPLININKIISEFFSTAPVVLSVDVEGFDADIIKSIDMTRYRPTIICAETITYSTNNSEVRLSEIEEYLLKNEYFVYADTYINTIFVDRRVWDARPH